MNTNWTFYDGSVKYPFDTFPYAFRCMYFALQKAVKAGKSAAELTKKYTITAKTGKVYSYAKATELATTQGVLTPEGTLDNREFKRR